MTRQGNDTVGVNVSKIACKMKVPSAAVSRTIRDSEEKEMIRRMSNKEVTKKEIDRRNG